jgi:8-oxo-dGTP pyrophosphatase MutT (NUDIX family)
MPDLPEILSKKLSPVPSHTISESSARPAAVLIPIFSKGGIWHVLYTRRTDSVEDHQGQVSFPGGVIEANDEGPLQAALRETQEEIGIQSEDVHILGALKPHPTVTNFIVVPIVGTIPWPYQFNLNEQEVAVVFSVPLDWLANPDNLEIQEWKPEGPWPSVPVHFFRPYEGEIIWGATARITLSLLKVLQ